MNEKATEVVDTIKEGLGIDEDPPDIADEGTEAEDNEDIIDTEEAEVELTGKKEELTGILDRLYTSTMGLKSKVDELVEMLVQEGSGGGCSVSIGTAGSIGFCDVDFSVVRGVMITCAAIVSLILLMM